MIVFTVSWDAIPIVQNLLSDNNLKGRWSDNHLIVSDSLEDRVYDILWELEQKGFVER